MGTGQQTGNQPMNQAAKSALNKFKYEVANELNIPTQDIQNGYWGNVSSRDCGAVGGHMVRKMIRQAEKELENIYGGGGQS